MKNIIVVGDILIDKSTNTRYRVVAADVAQTMLCTMDITKLTLTEHLTSSLIQLLYDGMLEMDKDEDFLFEKDSLPDTYREKYEATKAAMGEILNLYKARLLELPGKSSKPELYAILQKYAISKSSFWRTLTKYFQSGFREYTLVDARYFGHNKGKEYNYSSKTGRPPEYFGASGKLVDDEVKEYFEEALKEYRSGRQKNLKTCFDRMNAMHYIKKEIINGQATITLLPESQRPTLRQFYYYADKQLTKQEKDRIKTSIQEQRNNKRLLLSDALSEVYGPGDMVEIDACEADVSLVSSFDNNRTIGRPVVYFMIDVFSRIILAVSVAFDNNSVLGITNLLLNLADDKKEYCARYGIGFDDDRLWPSNIIPRRIRVDRGSEFKSKEFERICNELGIEKQLVPGASGSLKGVVEQSFHQMHSKQNAHTENYGLIEKRYDSEHHKEATLDIDEYTKMVINFVVAHNQEYNKNYRVTPEMVKNGIRAIPAILWKYGVEKYGLPRPITDKNQYLFNLLTPVKAKLSRKGISYKNLYYLPNDDPVLAREMFDAGTKRIPFEARMDMRDVGNVFYIRDGRLVVAPLNKRLTGNSEFAGYTMKKYEDFLASKGEMNAKGKVYNEEIAAFSYSVNASIMDAAKKEQLSDAKNMRPARELEKQAVSAANNIIGRMGIEPEEIEEKIPEEVKTSAKPDGSGKKIEPSSWEEALNSFWEEN